MSDVMGDVRKIVDDHRKGRMLVSCETSFRVALAVTELRGTLQRIDTFITAVAPSKVSKEMDSIRSEVRAALAGVPAPTTDDPEAVDDGSSDLGLSDADLEAHA